MKLTVCCEPRAPIFSALLRKSKHSHIDRERKAIKSLRFKLRREVRGFLKHVAPNVARQVIHTRTLLGKAGANEDEIQRILDSLNLDWETLATATEPIIRSILQDSGKVALEQIDAMTSTALELVNKRAVEYAKERAAELVTRVSESTRAMLRSDVADAMEQGWSNDKLAAVLEDGYAFSGDRAEMIARTETAYADVQGNLGAYRDSGVVEMKQWITGAGCCDLCDELNGETIPLEDSFKTEDGDIDGPPYHPNCRCDILPITKGEDVADE